MYMYVFLYVYVYVYVYVYNIIAEEGKVTVNWALYYIGEYDP